MKRALVTGSNGHIGSHVVKELSQRGVETVGLVRRSSDRRSLANQDVTIVEGDLFDRDSLRRAMEGCEVVFHGAANFCIWSPDPETITDPAVTGTRNVLEIARAAGVTRVVYTSSAAAVGASSRADLLRDEEDWMDGPRVAYYRAKIAGERLARELADGLGLELVVICPTMVLGRGDYRITPSTKVVLDLLNGGGATIDGGTNLVSAAEVGRAQVLAAERAEAGARLLIGGENITLEQLGGLVEEISGQPSRHLSLPKWSFLAMAAVMEVGAKLSGNPPPLTRAAVHDLHGKYAWYDCSKAERLLGFRAQSAYETIDETVSWLLESDALKPKAAATIRSHRAANQRAA